MLRKLVSVAGGCMVAAVVGIILGALLLLAALAVPVLGPIVLSAWAIIALALYLVLSRIAPGAQDRRLPARHGRASPRELLDAAEPAEMGLLGASALVLAVAAGLVSTGHAAASLTNFLSTMLLGVAGVGGIGALLLRWLTSGASGECPSDRGVRAQGRRIARKCRKLAREAQRAGGVHADLAHRAPEMGRRAGELADLVLRLRRAEREVRGGRVDGADHPLPDVRLREEVEAARTTRQRIEGLIARSRRRRELCLARLERIEATVDGARLQVASSSSPEVELPQASEVVDEVEMELRAAREALEEVQRLEAQEAADGQGW